MTEIKPVVIVHGGAGSHKVIVGDPEARKSIEEGVIQAARVGYNVLMKEGSSLDAVESAVISLEDDPVFNAGKYLDQVVHPNYCLFISGSPMSVT